MPPKKKDPKAEKGQQKALEREKQKIIEDKTFGLKNKNKSKAVQKFIKSVQQQASGPKKGGEAQEIAKKKQEQQAKKAQLQQQLLLQTLFKGTENIKKVAEESRIAYDPKTSKQEQKIDLYIDQRDQKENCEGWTGELETDIVCKHFLEAVERKQYGWFWVCPNGGDSCKYRHCLPEGYVLKSDEPVEEEEEEEPIEEVVERERQALPPGGTPVTKETFAAWKAAQEKRRQEEVEEQRAAAAKKAGGASRGLDVLSGRDLFSFDPSLFVDVEGAADEADYEEDADWQEEVRRNQEQLDAANAEAQRVAAEGLREEAGDEDQDEDGHSDGHSEEETCKRTDTEGTQPLNENLFLEGDIPEDLEALDD